MLLALDAGNTNIVAGVIDRGRIVCTGRIATRPHRTADEYALLLEGVLRLRGVDTGTLEGGILSSVVPPLTGLLREAAGLLLGGEPLVVGPLTDTGLTNRMENPARTGSDLTACCVAAATRFPLPLVVIDMGTATTLSTLDARGDYVGNIILPGAALMRDALTGRAALLPRVDLQPPRQVAARSTEESMQSGLVLGSAAMVDGLLDRIEAELGAPVHAVATGGLAPLVLPHCRREIRHQPDLLLLGLWDIFRRNQHPQRT